VWVETRKVIGRADVQPGDRRDRLKYVQEQIENAKGDRAMPDFMDEDSSDEDDEEVSRANIGRGDWHSRQGEFYTEGPNELLEARRKIARYSLSK